MLRDSWQPFVTHDAGLHEPEPKTTPVIRWLARYDTLFKRRSVILLDNCIPPYIDTIELAAIDCLSLNFSAPRATQACMEGNGGLYATCSAATTLYYTIS